MGEDSIHEESISNPEEQIEGEFVPNLSEEIPQVNEKIKRLRWWYVIVILYFVFLAVGIFFMPVTNLDAPGIYDFKYWDLYEVGHDVLGYFEKNNQQFPAVEKWCDTMLGKDEFYSFKFYEDNKENFPYILNRNIAGLNKIPDNMVVLFSGERGWNQVGGIESVGNQNRLRVFMGNGETGIFRERQIPHLRWKYEDSDFIPKPDVKVGLLVMSVLLGIVFLSILVVCRKSLRIFWIFALGMGILSGCVGTFLGGMAEVACYRLSSAGDPVVPWAGSIWGFVIGVSFVAIIGNIYKKYSTKVSMLGYSTVIGGMTGIIASSIVHGYLMIAYEEESFVYMLAGSYYGVVAGLVLGWVSSGVIRLYKRPGVLESTGEEVF